MRVTRISEVDENLEVEVPRGAPEGNEGELDQVEAEIAALKKKLSKLQSKKEDIQKGMPLARSGRDTAKGSDENLLRNTLTSTQIEL